MLSGASSLSVHLFTNQPEPSTEGNRLSGFRFQQRVLPQGTGQSQRVCVSERIVLVLACHGSHLKGVNSTRTTIH